MSSISSLSSTSTLSPFQKVRSNKAGRPNGPPPDGKGPGDFSAKIDDALEAQGLSGTKLSDLRTKIQSAIESAKSSTQSTDGTASSTDPREAIRSAVDGVLKDAGVNVSQFEAALKPKDGDKHGKSDAASSATATDQSSSTSAQFDAYLQSKGIDPDNFKSTLLSSLNSGNSDLSSSFAGASTGSDVDIYA